MFAIGFNEKNSVELQYLFIAVEQSVPGEHDRRPAVLDALRQRQVFGRFPRRGVLRGVGEAVEVVRVKEADEGSGAVAFLAAEVAVDDELVQLHRRQRDGRFRDVRREGGPREDLLEDLGIGVLVVVPGRIKKPCYTR